MMTFFASRTFSTIKDVSLGFWITPFWGNL